MFPANKGLIVDVTGLGQLSDMNGTQLVFTKTVGTIGTACQNDTYTASGTNTAAYSWAYEATAKPENPTRLVINVTKTPL